MKLRGVLVLAAGIVFVGCEDKSEVVVTETRRATTKDESPKLFATPDERFRNARPSPVQAETPEGWREVPSSEFRLLNYRFGETGLGEVWVSLSAGSVLDNVNRWLGQFGAAPLTAAQLAELRAVPIADTTGVWVEAEGEYASGMGAPPKPGYALAGVIAESDGQILTAKMVGPRAEVESAKEQLETFARSLRRAE